MANVGSEVLVCLNVCECLSFCKKKNRTVSAKCVICERMSEWSWGDCRLQSNWMRECVCVIERFSRREEKHQEKQKTFLVSPSRVSASAVFTVNVVVIVVAVLVALIDNRNSIHFIFGQIQKSCIPFSYYFCKSFSFVLFHTLFVPGIIRVFVFIVNGCFCRVNNFSEIFQL